MVFKKHPNITVANEAISKDFEMILVTKLIECLGNEFLMFGVK